MELTVSQITQANALIKKHRFCSIETQKKLQSAGFFDIVNVNWCLRKHFGEIKLIERDGLILNGCNAEYLFPFPQFEDIWEALPSIDPSQKESELQDGKIGFKTLNTLPSAVAYKSRERGAYIYEFNDNIAEAAARLWLRLRKENHL